MIKKEELWKIPLEIFAFLTVGANCVRPPLNRQNSLAAFLFDTTGAKRKANKRKTPLGNFVACGRRGGLRSLHRALFLKKEGQKLSHRVRCEHFTL